MGRFRTHEEALKVAEELRDYQRRLAESEEGGDEFDQYYLVEVEYSQKYNIEWQEYL